jgi:hypothetical protein
MKQVFARLKGKNVLVVFIDGEKLEGKVLSVEDGGTEIESFVADPTTKSTSRVVVFINQAAVKTVRAL